MKKIILILLCFACSDKEEVTPRNYPRVATSAPTGVTAEEATLHATITYSPGEIIDHGFLISPQSLPDFDNSIIDIPLGPAAGTGAFEAVAEYSSLPGKEYYVRGYAKSSTYTVLGNVLTFKKP